MLLGVGICAFPIKHKCRQISDPHDVYISRYIPINYFYIYSALLFSNNLLLVICRDKGAEEKADFATEIVIFDEIVHHAFKFYLHLQSTKEMSFLQTWLIAMAVTYQQLGY